MKKIWPFSFYFLYYAAFASLMPFFVIFYQSLGFNGTQIGLLAGIPPLITLFGAPLGTGLADLTHRHKLIMGLGLLAAVAVSIFLPNVSGFVVVFGLIILFNIFMSPIASLSDSATMNMLGDQKAMYGRIRMGGTLGWGIFALVAGVLVENYGLQIAFRLFSVTMFINFLVSQKFYFGNRDEHSSNTGGIKTLLRNRRRVFFLLNAFLGGVGASTVASYLYPYMAELGAAETTMGIALTIATITELPVFFFGDRLIKKFSSHGLFMIALVLIGVRSLFYAIASAPFMVLIIQAIGGTMFPAMWLAGVSYVDANAPAGLKSTAQGLFGAMSFGFGSAFGGFAGGLLLGSIGGRGMFLVVGIVILAGLALVEGASRLSPEKEVVKRGCKN
ncbi:MAG TPA: major facilitator superfamily domain-containing protein 6 [Anaerolineales bacterium]|nr:major facilitator superfamily domain-containing protein 6 [Anaerolineales bacterium]